MHRTWAMIERELRRFRRSPMLIVMSMVFPFLQLIVLGYAFGGNVRNLTIAVVDQDGGVPAVRVRELAGAVAANAKTFPNGTRHWSASSLGTVKVFVHASRQSGSEERATLWLLSTKGKPTSGTMARPS